MNPLVSICIPVYNRKNTVRRAIQSAIDQTYPNIEIIIVDNASTDGTFATLEEYAKLDPRIAIFKNATNVGAVRNWLRCAELSSGTYVKYLYSDDWLLPDSVQLLVEPFLTNDIAFSHGMALFEISHASYPPAYKRNRDLISSFDFLLEHAKDGESMVSQSVAMYKRAPLLKAFVLEVPSSDANYCNTKACGHDALLFFNLCLTSDYYFSINKPCVVLSSSNEEPSVSEKAVLDGESDRKLGCYRYALAHFIESNPQERWRFGILRICAFLRDVRPTKIFERNHVSHLVRVWRIGAFDIARILGNRILFFFFVQRTFECFSTFKKALFRF